LIKAAASVFAFRDGCVMVPIALGVMYFQW
jgi:hypothetical protein